MLLRVHVMKYIGHGPGNPLGVQPGHQMSRVTRKTLVTDTALSWVWPDTGENREVDGNVGSNYVCIRWFKSAT